MNARSRWTGLIIFVVLLIGCPSPIEGRDRVPPKVLSISPSDQLLETSPQIEFKFSKPILPQSVDDEHVVLVDAETTTDAFLKAFTRLKLSKKHRSALIPITVALSEDGLIIQISPTTQLMPSHEYSILMAQLRDLSGNPLVNEKGEKAIFQHDFKTRSAPPTLSRYDFGAEIAPNRKAVRFEFSEPIVFTRIDGIRLLAGSLEEKLPPTELDADRKIITVYLPQLKSDANYEFILGMGIQNDDQIPMMEQRVAFKTAPENDTTLHQITGVVTVLPMETSAQIKVETTKPGQVRLWFGDKADALNCLEQTCPIAVPMPQSRQEIALTGLELGRSYYYELASEDAVGQVAFAKGNFKTVPMAKLAISEIMTNPIAPKGKKAQGQYIELHNYGSEPISVSGLMLGIEGGAQSYECLLGGNSVKEILPNGYLLLVSSRFQIENYQGLNESVLHRSRGVQLCGSLTSSRPQKIWIKDGLGRVVSSYGGHLMSKEAGRSVERLESEAADEVENFCLSQTRVGPTPGRPNGSRS